LLGPIKNIDFIENKNTLLNHMEKNTPKTLHLVFKLIREFKDIKGKHREKGGLTTRFTLDSLIVLIDTQVYT
jgi:hypothetical protein